MLSHVCVCVAELWDHLFVGLFVAYKRPWLLADKPGRKLAIGRLDLSPDMLVRGDVRA
jgi:hypothetical protein